MALTAMQVKEVKYKRAQRPPVSWNDLAREYGYSAETIRADVDPVYRAERTKRIREARHARSNGGPRRPSGRPFKNLEGRNLEGRNGKTVTRSKKQNFAFRGSALPLAPKLPHVGVPDMDEAGMPGVEYLANEGCKWILGDRRGGPHNLPLCCGGDRGGDPTYCNYHRAKSGTGNYGHASARRAWRTSPAY